MKKLNLSGYILNTSHIMGYLPFNNSIALTVPSEVLTALNVESKSTDGWYRTDMYLWILEEHQQYTQLMEHLTQ